MGANFSAREGGSFALSGGIIHFLPPLICPFFRGSSGGRCWFGKNKPKPMSRYSPAGQKIVAFRTSLVPRPTAGTKGGTLKKGWFETRIQTAIAAALGVN
jgi:hypothetical protein